MNRHNEKIDFAQRVRLNQERLRSSLKPQYDFIVCGSGSSGSVVARRLAENPEVSVLLLEAGGDDDVPGVTESLRWFENFGTERQWDFEAQANPHLNGRAIPLPMGKELGGGSSVNVFNAVYVTYFHGNFPTRAFIGTDKLVCGGRFEVIGIAVKRSISTPEYQSRNYLM